MTNQTIELLVVGSEYRDIVTKAKEVGVYYVNVKKDILFENVNAKIQMINDGKAELPVLDTPVVEDENVSTEEGEVTSTPTAKRERTPAAPRVKAPKWFEEKDANPYQAGDVVQIETGKDLIGRKVEVVQPSTKKNALKGYLINPVNGQRQKTFLSVDFDRVVLVERDGQPVNQEEDQKAV